MKSGRRNRTCWLRNRVTTPRDAFAGCPCRYHEDLRMDRDLLRRRNLAAMALVAGAGVRTA